ncbi:microtubule associated-domain-containing protein [Lactifluus subvellereus]|nr:microtubule associated-domain-containing protein [Lactifluus subvellereus]
MLHFNLWALLISPLVLSSLAYQLLQSHLEYLPSLLVPPPLPLPPYLLHRRLMYSLNTRGKRSKSSATNPKGNNLTLRDQEKHIDNLKKENFNIKLKVHFLEERLAQLAPDQVEAALKQNINLKIEVQQRGMELKKVRKLVLELENELQRIQRGDATRSSRERELEALLEKRGHETESCAVASPASLDKMMRLYVTQRTATQSSRKTRECAPPARREHGRTRATKRHRRAAGGGHRY